MSLTSRVQTVAERPVTTMFQHKITRRKFGTASASAAALLLLGDSAASQAADADRKSSWSIGCFNRPWGRWTYDEALDGLRAAGFELTGLLGDHANEPFVLPDATEDYLDRLHDRITARGLSVNVAWLRTNHEIPLAEAMAAARKQIDHAQRLGAKFLLTTGADDPDTYEHYYQTMADASAYAAQREMQVAIKPHGGCSASADEILRCVERVDHDGFRVWYDAGNIVHYTDVDPVADVERLGHLVVGFSAKDCGRRGGDVMLPFGEGQVDFRGVFQKLQAAGFDGPVMVECCAGQTLEEVTGGARANREYLQRLFAAL